MLVNNKLAYIKLLSELKYVDNILLTLTLSNNFKLGCLIEKY